MSDKEWASMQDLVTTKKADRKQGRRNGSKCQWLIITKCESEWFRWRVSVSLNADETQVQKSVSVQANFYIPHAAKQIQFLKFTGTFLSLSCIVTSSASIEERRCSDWMCKCHPIRRTVREQLDKNKHNRQKGTLCSPRNILVSHPPFYTQLYLTLQDCFFTEMNQFMCHKTNGRET